MPSTCLSLPATLSPHFTGEEPGARGGGLPTRDSVPSRPCVRRSGPPGTLGPWKLYPKQVLPGLASRRLSGPGPRQQQQAQGRCPRAWFCAGPGAAREPLRTAQLVEGAAPGTSCPVPRDPRTPPPPPPPTKLGSWLGGGVVGQRLHTEGSSDSDRGLCCGHKTDEDARSHGPSVGVSPKFVCSNLIPGVMVVGGGTLGRCTCHEGRASGMGPVPSQERPRELPRPFHRVRTWPGCGPPGTRTPAGTAHRAPVPAPPSHLASRDRSGVDRNCVWRRGWGGGKAPGKVGLLSAAIHRAAAEPSTAQGLRGGPALPPAPPPGTAVPCEAEPRVSCPGEWGFTGILLTAESPNSRRPVPPTTRERRDHFSARPQSQHRPDTKTRQKQYRTSKLQTQIPHK